MIGERIKYFRASKGLSQKKLAKMTGLGRATISRLERGEANARTDTLEKIARALGVSSALLNVEIDDSSTTEMQKSGDLKAQGFKKIYDTLLSPELKKLETKIMNKFDTEIELLKEINKKIGRLEETREH